MARPTKLTYEIQQKIGENIALGLPYSLTASTAGITYQMYNEWMKRRQTEKSGKYYNFAQYIQKCNADAAKECLKRLNSAAEAENCQICMWILERRFPDEFGKRVYRKRDVVSESLNQNVEIVDNDVDKIREKILEKLILVREAKSNKHVKFFYFRVTYFLIEYSLLFSPYLWYNCSRHYQNHHPGFFATLLLQLFY